MNEQSIPGEKPLNLGKFNPAKSVPDATVPPSEEGETMFIRRTTAAAVEQHLPPAEQQTPEFGLPVKEMLGVITYCYARGIFNSGEIAARIRLDSELRRALGANLPDESAVRRFRRKYSGEIEDALELLYQVFPPQDPVLPSAADVPAEKLPHQQAGARLHDAIWADNKLPGRPTSD